MLSPRPSQVPAEPPPGDAAPPAGGSGGEAARLLDVVRTLARELQPTGGRVHAVTLDSRLDRDLGLDSLGRAELILRVNQAFGVRLPDRMLNDADTPRDLWVALRAAGSGGAEGAVPGRDEAAEPPRTAEPEAARTLVEALAFHAAGDPGRRHLRIWLSEDRERVVTFGELQAAASRVAAGLIARGLAPGERVAIMLPTGADFFEAFFGTLHAGGIPVPIYPPFRRSQLEEHLRRQAGILRNAEASFLLVDEDLWKLGSLLSGLADSLRRVETVSSLSASAPLDAPAAAGPETVALIQYTSGSTGDPKGVVLTHGNLLANIRAMGEVVGARSDDVFVSWLPLYHDMGLIGAWLGSLYFGATLAVMPPLAFLADPLRWLRAISRHRATLSAAPNFAFDLCCRAARDHDLRGLDLGSLRMIANGAEPVSPVTMVRFIERFGPCGFRPGMMGPVYGLAENAVGLAFPPAGRPPIVDRIRRAALSAEGVAMPAADDDATALTFVACGRPLPGHQIRIVDDAGRELPERSEGRLQFKGPSATSGYFRNAAKNRTLFDGAWLESGDRAYVASGDVFITGRIKDIIIKAGRNIYPHEIEDLVGQLEGARKGGVAAIASPDSRTGTERLVLVVETRLHAEEAREGLRRRATEACMAILSMPPDAIELVPPRSIPKTSSGKVRRAATRALYESGSLASRPRSLPAQLLRLRLAAVASQARRWRRQAAVLAYAGGWWATLLLLAAVTWILVLLLPARDRRQGVVRRAATTFLRLTGTPVEVIAVTALPQRAVLVVNHSSYLDPLVVSAVIPGRLTFVAKAELATQRVAGPFLRRLGTVFARRTAAAGGVEDTERQRRAVRDGDRLVTFPEGTLTRMPGLLAFRLGAFLVAAQEGVPVVPVTVTGTRAILRGEQWLPRRGAIAVRFDEPVLADGSDFAAAVRLRDRVRAIMLERCGEPDLARERVALPMTPSAP